MSQFERDARAIRWMLAATFALELAKPMSPTAMNAAFERFERDIKLAIAVQTLVLIAAFALIFHFGR